MANELKRIQIYEGMEVATVKKKGSDGQKLMASLFDTNGDGIYSKGEAAYFNKHDFKTENGKITVILNESDGSKKTTKCFLKLSIFGSIEKI